MNKKQLAILNYKRFCELDGSQYIASEFALEIILNLIKKFKVERIVELGLGIGSISDTVLKYSKKSHSKTVYFGTEKNEFCLKALKENVEDYNHIELYSELNQIQNEKFDLIIIDGYDDTLKEIVSYCNENAIIFIEGDRKGQTLTILDVFPKSKYVNIITLNKNKSYSHVEEYHLSSYVGGGQLIFTNPTVKMKLFWIKEKVATYFKIKYRNYNS